jgi:hypothetical protein
VADNTTLNPGVAGDQIRTIQKSVNSPAKTEVVTIDIGGGTDTSPETIVGPAASLPVVLQAPGGYGADIATKLDLIYAELRLIATLLSQDQPNISDLDTEFRKDPSYFGQ